jgi:hypothetical protein
VLLVPPDLVRLLVLASMMEPFLLLQLQDLQPLQLLEEAQGVLPLLLPQDELEVLEVGVTAPLMVMLVEPELLTKVLLVVLDIYLGLIIMVQVEAVQEP